ncbi:hypothetical protein [Variovorax sp. N23]|uniref:hypothetical protein n=1 Tax=Variovorax sp. N23 TaxID=2980555 RepID=UPI0021CA9647|nr:hypothetical protein [Variovorax sp. N23]MCU4119322.1 hypothetical protein [Variovorax sp. N23]
MKTDTALDDILKPIAGLVLVVPGVILLIAASATWRGYVLSILWGWFMVPAFGLPGLTVPLAIGLALVIGFLTERSAKKKEDFDWGIAIAQLIFSPAIALLIGWIVTRFM